MTSPPSRLKIYGSPKRKRGERESIGYSPEVSPRTCRISTNPAEYHLPEELQEGTGRLDDGSPSSRVTGQLQTLDLQGAFVGGQITSDSDASHPKKRFAQSGEQRPASSNGADRQYFSQEPGSANSIVIPQNVNSEDEPPAVFSTTIVDRPRAKGRSPPLDGDPEDNPMTWHESEITGHNPTDPNDDGYGINGIGFKPTPAIAWARSRRRKQQLADYRNREAREARQRRSERRGGSADETSTTDVERAKKRDVKVRFGGIDCG